MKMDLQKSKKNGSKKGRGGPWTVMVSLEVKREEKALFP